MFDKIYLPYEKTSYVPYDKTVTINRAPTDESIKLYEEIKEKAYTSILNTIELHNNILNISAIVYRNILGFGITCQFILVLNGERHEHKFNVREEHEMDIIKNIYDEASKIIAVNLVESLIKHGRLNYDY